jgi:hypothetical protein
LHTTTNHIYAEETEGGYDRTCGCRETLGKGESIVLGAVKLGGWREYNKIDDFIKKIIFLAGLSI